MGRKKYTNTSIPLVVIQYQCTKFSFPCFLLIFLLFCFVSFLLLLTTYTAIDCYFGNRQQRQQPTTGKRRRRRKKVERRRKDKKKGRRRNEKKEERRRKLLGLNPNLLLNVFGRFIAIFERNPAFSSKKRSNRFSKTNKSYEAFFDLNAWVPLLRHFKRCFFKP